MEANSRKRKAETQLTKDSFERSENDGDQTETKPQEDPSQNSSKAEIAQRRILKAKRTEPEKGKLNLVSSLNFSGSTNNGDKKDEKSEEKPKSIFGQSLFGSIPDDKKPTTGLFSGLSFKTVTKPQESTEEKKSFLDSAKSSSGLFSASAASTGNLLFGMKKDAAKEEGSDDDNEPLKSDSPENSARNIVQKVENSPYQTEYTKTAEKFKTDDKQKGNGSIILCSYKDPTGGVSAYIHFRSPIGKLLYQSQILPKFAACKTKKDKANKVLFTTIGKGDDGKFKIVKCQGTFPRVDDAAEFKKNWEDLVTKIGGKPAVEQTKKAETTEEKAPEKKDEEPAVTGEEKKSD